MQIHLKRCKCLICVALFSGSDGLINWSIMRPVMAVFQSPPVGAGADGGCERSA